MIKLGYQIVNGLPAAVALQGNIISAVMCPVFKSVATIEIDAPDTIAAGRPHNVYQEHGLTNA